VVAAARHGEGWAFERLYEALSPVVLGYLRSQGCADAEGAVSEVFLRVFRKLGDFEGTEAQLRSWVFTIAHNLLVDQRRMLSGRRADQPLHDRLELPGGDVEDDAMTRMAEGRARQLLDLLPRDQRDVLLLRVVADLSLEEAAVAMDRTVGAVKALQHRALASLRRRLDDLAVAPEAVSPQLS
jgi:RNA polymerase sigma-70 factor (ECF subfamily)